MGAVVVWGGGEWQLPVLQVHRSFIHTASIQDPSMLLKPTLNCAAILRYRTIHSDPSSHPAPNSHPTCGSPPSLLPPPPSLQYENTGGADEWLSPDGTSLNNWMGEVDTNGVVLDQSADPYDSGEAMY